MTLLTGSKSLSLSRSSTPVDMDPPDEPVTEDAMDMRRSFLSSARMSPSVDLGTFDKQLDADQAPASPQTGLEVIQSDALHRVLAVPGFASASAPTSPDVSPRPSMPYVEPVASAPATPRPSDASQVPPLHSALAVLPAVALPPPEVDVAVQVAPETVADESAHQSTAVSLDALMQTLSDRMPVDRVRSPSPAVVVDAAASVAVDAVEEAGRTSLDLPAVTPVPESVGDIEAALQMSDDSPLFTPDLTENDLGSDAADLSGDDFDV
jgi:hypothetical protein